MIQLISLSGSKFRVGVRGGVNYWIELNCSAAELETLISL